MKAFQHKNSQKYYYENLWTFFYWKEESLSEPTVLDKDNVDIWPVTDQDYIQDLKMCPVE